MNPCPACNACGWRNIDGQPSPIADEPSRPCDWCINGYITEAKERIYNRLMALRCNKYTAAQIADGLMRTEAML